MATLKEISIHTSTYLKLLNSIKSNADIEALHSCDTEEDILSLSFMTGARIAYNLNSISDDNMGTSTPVLKMEGYPVFCNRDEAFSWDIEESGWSRRGASYSDVGRVDSALLIDNTKYFIQDGVTITNEEIGDFDRVGAFIQFNDTINPLFLGETSNGFKWFILSYNRAAVGQSKIIVKTITDEEISEGINLNVYINNEITESLNSRTANIICNIWQGNPVIDTWSTDGANLNVLDMSIRTSCLGSQVGDTALLNANYDIRSNVWLFDSETNLNNYLRTGDYTEALNYNSEARPEEPAEEDDTVDKEYYVHSQIWESSKPSDADKTYTRDRWTKIKISKSVNRPFVLEPSDNQTLHLYINNVDDSDIVYMKESSDGGETWHNVTLGTFHNNWWRWTKTLKKSAGLYEGAECYTNIPVFSSNLQKDLYFNNLIDETASLNPSKSFIDDITDKIVDIGKSVKIKNDLNIVRVDSSMSELILSDETFFNELAGLFNDDSIVTQIKQGLQLHSNPQDIFIDLFALPFEVTPLVINSIAKNKMDFGTYEHTFSNTFKIISRPKEVTMFSTKITPIFNDWRDYQLSFSLYLPYCNFIHLPLDEIMNGTLSCTFVFDVASATVKYFIKSNNITIQTVEGSVRYGLPLSASNNLQGFMQKFGGASQIVGSSLNYRDTKINSSADILGAGSKGDVGGVFKGYYAQQRAKLDLGVGIAKGVVDIMKPTPKEYSGNYSNSCAFYDELEAYLIIEQADIVYPAEIQKTYNLPDNRVANIGSCTGYFEASNVEVVGNATAGEKAEIINLLASGCIM